MTKTEGYVNDECIFHRDSAHKKAVSRKNPEYDVSLCESVLKFPGTVLESNVL